MMHQFHSGVGYIRRERIQNHLMMDVPPVRTWTPRDVAVYCISKAMCVVAVVFAAVIAVFAGMYGF